MATRFWARYKASPLLAELGGKTAYFIKAVAAIYIVRENLVEFTVCVGPSMMPTFNPRGDIALLEHVTVWSGRVEVGDVVLARSAQNPRHMVCKRVLGLEGDSVYVPSSTKLGLGRTVTVPRGHVWLQGDNFNNSTDSRHYGPVPYALLRGRVFLKVWPIWESGWIENKLPPWQEEEMQRQRHRRQREAAARLDR
ncbi:Mitochondrial inner membrane protease subunit 1 [Micractinium conductrix]|uniref:Mitochondrial inner membrane protease subunit 1 n=1 Tax=Micractinium conductrix TaxID=554055 RepID=A0A2P6VIN0_9CHLO|nr:Mitochondrial inner membrane protease subunit 1 [Micractinium conductrix]|eukprot:PSC73932.1 Mitochondrial inner membrane protease subunit 1 [Micractinium conductrix]